MMSPDDARHGTNAGYVAGCRNDCCREASFRYAKRLKYEHAHGERRSVESWRAVRRLDALAWLGWSRGAVANAMGVKHKAQIYAIGTHPRMYIDTFERLDAVYADLSMRLPVAETHAQNVGIIKTRNNARRRGAVPPLAWDDIDNDPEPPTVTTAGDWEDQVDHAIVTRVLDTRTRPRQLTRAEAAEVVRVLLSRGMSTHRIEKDYGINTARYQRKEVA